MGKLSDAGNGGYPCRHSLCRGTRQRTHYHDQRWGRGMKFKIDENLPTEIAEILRTAGYDALTVRDEAMMGEVDSQIMRICQHENRILVTIDTDFADIRSYPPRLLPGIMVLRLSRQ